MPEPYMNSVPDELDGRPGARARPDAAPPAARSSTAAASSPSAAPGRSPCVCVLAAPEGITRLDASRPRQPRRDGVDRRAPQRPRLHRPGPRRRRRPPLRHRLSRPRRAVYRPWVARRAVAAARTSSTTALAARRAAGDVVVHRDHGLGVALQLGLGAARADDEPGAVERPDQDVARQGGGVPVGEVLDARPPLARPPRRAASRRTDAIAAVTRASQSLPVEPDRPLAGDVGAVGAERSRRADRAASAPRPCSRAASSAATERGGDAVLVAHQRRRRSSRAPPRSRTGTAGPGAGCAPPT